MAKSPSGTCDVIGLWFDRPQEPSALAVVHQALLAFGVRNQDGKPFTGSPDDEWSYVLMQHQHLGLVRLAYETTMETLPAAQHPVLILIQSPLDGVPDEYLSGREKHREMTRRRAGAKLMKALCDGLDPAYAIDGGDATHIPTPADLAKRHGTLDLTFYVARRLAVAVSVPASRTEEWEHGTHCTPAKRFGQTDAYYAAVGEISRSVGRALTRPRRL